MESGTRIRALREQRSLKPSDVERITRRIAENRRNTDFCVSHSTLADIEAGSIPSVHKLFSLAVCLQVPLKDLLLPFGIDPEEITNCGVESASKALTFEVPAPASAFRFQLNFDTNFISSETSLLRLTPRELEKLPVFFNARLDPVRYRFAVIGSKDDMMADVLPPQSLVEIDASQNEVRVFPWRNLWHRPIYLIWHADGHSCCWCQIDGKELTLIPHPLSRKRIRRFKLPSQAAVVGRVTNAWLPFAPVRLARETVLLDPRRK